MDDDAALAEDEELRHRLLIFYVPSMLRCSDGCRNLVRRIVSQVLRYDQLVRVEHILEGGQEIVLERLLVGNFVEASLELLVDCVGEPIFGLLVMR